MTRSMQRWGAGLGAILLGFALEAQAQNVMRCDQQPNLAASNGTACPTQTITTEWTIGAGKVLTFSNFGASFGESDTNPPCAAGDFRIYADASENRLKKCQNGTPTDLDTGGTVNWNDVGNPTGNQTLTMAANTSTWTWNAATGAGVDMLTLTDTASNTGTGYVVSLATAASSAAKPVRVTAGGTSNGVDMSTAGLLAPIGTGGIQASDVVCTTCVGTTDVANNAIDGTKIGIGTTNGDLLQYDGTDWARLGVGASATFLRSNGTTWAATAISAADIGAGDMANVLAWGELLADCDPDCTLAASPRDTAGADATVQVFSNGILMQPLGACGGVNQFTIAAGGVITPCDVVANGGPVLAYYER